MAGSISLALASLSLVLAAALFVAVRVARSRRARIEELEAETARQRQNIAYLVRHAEEIASIEADKDAAQGKISEARSDEEIAEIVAAVVGSNNGRVRDAPGTRA